METLCADPKKDPTRGKLPPGGMLRVRSIETGELLGPGQKGELCFKNDFVCSDYWKNPNVNEQVQRHYPIQKLEIVPISPTFVNTGVRPYIQGWLDLYWRFGLL